MRRIAIVSPFVVVLLVSLLVAGQWSGRAQEATPSGTDQHCPSPLDAASASPAASPAGAADASPMAMSDGEPVCVGVLEGEFYIEPERMTFRVGETYVFAVGNEGTVVHEFVLEPAGSTEEAPLEAEDGEAREAEIEEIEPGQTAELEWTFAEPGRYQFACHREDHFQLGMVVEIEVTD